jgi:hypothetical protein
MFDTTLIVVGDSFVYGQLEDDFTAESCHERSWVRQLEKIAGFKNSVNLGIPGGSNYRSYRVLFDYLEKNYQPDQKYFVIFAVSELSRFELPMRRGDIRLYGLYPEIPYSYDTYDNDIHPISIGSWTTTVLESFADDPARLIDFFNIHRGLFYYDEYSRVILRNNLFSTTTLLDSLNVRHFFTSTVFAPDELNNMTFLGKSLPVIKYVHNEHQNNIGGFLKHVGFNCYPCSHYDEHAYNFLANYIHDNYLKDK